MQDHSNDERTRNREEFLKRTGGAFAGATDEQIAAILKGNKPAELPPDIAKELEEMRREHYGSTD